MNQIMIGADPEFTLMRGERLVHAERHCIDIEGQLRQSFGVDGCSIIAEIRPKPATTPEQLLENTKTCLSEGFETEAVLYSWKAGSWSNAPIGGHIHFGFQQTTQFIRVLDYALALPLYFIEDREEEQRRRSYYGGFHSWRSQPHGFEYRTPPSWLVSQQICLEVYQLAFKIAELYQDPHFNNLMEFSRSDLHRNEDTYRSDALERLEVLCVQGEIYSLIRDKKTWPCKDNFLDHWDFPELKAYPTFKELWKEKLMKERER